jgi:hypothetical protein
VATIVLAGQRLEHDAVSQPESRGSPTDFERSQDRDTHLPNVALWVPPVKGRDTGVIPPQRRGGTGWCHNGLEPSPTRGRARPSEGPNMFTSQHRLARTTSTVAGLALLTLCVAAGPAAARQDAGPTPPRIDQAHCALARVGTEYVSCDNLTGNGVTAPAWIREL